MSGIDRWEALKSDPQTRNIPIVALSARALVVARERRLPRAATSFDTKSVEFDRLAATLRRVLAGGK